MNTEQQWRFQVILKNRAALKQFMDHHELKTAYALAKKANLKPGVVGHLVAGRRNTCSLRTAAAIEGALECPEGFLFVRKMSYVADDLQLTEMPAA